MSGKKPDLDGAIDLLRRMVMIPSSNLDDKTEILDFVTSPLEMWGYECTLVGDRTAPGLVATTGSGGIMLSGHLDTVPIGDGWTVEQGSMKGSMLYGRGSADMKGGCSAILLAAEALIGTDIPISIVFTTDEETKMDSAERIASTGVISKAPAIIVCEPTSVQIGGREKGLLQIRIGTRGKCSHAAMPQEGENAVHKMLELLDRLREMMVVPENPMESVTLNVDMIRGGQKVNVLPDSCEVEIDIRTPAGLMPDEVFEMVKGKIAAMDCELAILNRLKPILTPEDTPIIKMLREIRPGISMMDIAYATEMVKYAERNRNLIALGPGDPRQAHVPDEHVDVREVVEAAGIYVELCKRNG